MKKSERLSLIRKLVLEREIATQHELLKLLELEGLHLTQATISRDMNEIGIVKVPSLSGKYVYGIKEEPKTVIRPQRPIRSTILAISDPVVGLENMVHLDVVPGNSRLIKKFILEDFKDDVFSVIADDDSILIVLKSAESAQAVREKVVQWMDAQF